MLENFLGDEVFRIGISRFLKRFIYANAVTQDLWDELGKVAPDGTNVTKIMDTWTRQMGLPVVTVGKESRNLALLTLRKYCIMPLSLQGRYFAAYSYNSYRAHYVHNKWQ